MCICGKTVCLLSTLISSYDNNQAELVDGCSLSLPLNTQGKKKKQTGNTYPLKGCTCQAEGRNVCKLPTHAVCIYPRPALLCISCPVLSSNICCTCQSWPRAGQESTSQSTGTLKGCLQDAVQCDLVAAFVSDPPCPSHVVPKGACFLLRGYETVPEQTEIPLTWGHGPNFSVGSPRLNELDDGCCRYRGWDADRCVPLHMHAFFFFLSSKQVCCAARFMLVMIKLLA